MNFDDIKRAGRHHESCPVAISAPGGSDFGILRPAVAELFFLLGKIYTLKCIFH